MLFTDAATVNGTRKTRDGYLVADVRIARAGNIQLYGGAELDKPEMPVVRVWRPPEAIFDGAAMASFAHRPVTVEHPSAPVNAQTWKDHAVGFTGGEIVRDGEFIRVPLLLTDAAAIEAVEAGTREVSCGYACDIAWEPGTTPEGNAYDAKVTRVVGNHLAIVPKGRAGSECRIGDADGTTAVLKTLATLVSQNTATPTSTGGRPTMADELKTVVVDGLTISVPQQGLEAITKLQKQVGDAAAATQAVETRLRDAETKHVSDLQAKDGQIAAIQAKHGTDLQAKDGEIAGLKAAHEAAIQAKDGEIAALKAQVSDEALEQRAQARSALITQAKTILGDSFDGKGKSDADIRRDVVVKALGDKADPAASPAFFDAAFTTVMAMAPKTQAATQADPLRQAIAGGAGAQTQVGDAAKVPGWQRAAERNSAAWQPKTVKGNA